MENVIILCILSAIIGGIILYLVRAKKKGKTCIGCPYANQCQGKCNSNKK